MTRAPAPTPGVANPTRPGLIDGWRCPRGAVENLPPKLGVRVGGEGSVTVARVSRIDQPPGKFMRLFFRAPIYVYRSGLGRLMSKRMVMLTHTGRNSGQPRYAVVEVARHDEPSGTYFVPAAYGRKADWYLNILTTPEVELNHRGNHLAALAETLPAELAADEFAAYAALHPKSARNLGRMMGISFEDPGAVARKIPLVALRTR